MLTNKIINILKNNARISVKDLAYMVNSSEAEVDNIIKKLEKEKQILQYVTIINDEKISEKAKIRAVIQLCVRPEKKDGFDAIAQKICKYANVVDHYLISGQFDFLIIVEGESLQEISSFISEKLACLENVRNTATHFMLKKYKEKGVILENDAHETRLAVLL